MKGKEKIFHANMLKPYISRQTQIAGMEEYTAAAAVILEDEPESPLLLPRNLQQETVQHVNINPKLDRDRRRDVAELIKNGRPNQLKWGEDQERAFNSLKRSLSSQPVLKLPDLNQEFLLRTDASEKGLGAVLLQDVDGCKKPVAYASRKLLPREQRYAVVEKECLALVWGIQKFAPYLDGSKFVLEVDHKPLAYLNSAKELNPRLMR